jgi:subtilisin family serine protease
MTCDPFDDFSHGTHVAGIGGAKGNNSLGISGVNWTTKLMGLKVLNSEGKGKDSDAVNAIAFAIESRTRSGIVRVLNASWGHGGGESGALRDEIVRANGFNMLFVASAGNDGSNNDTVSHWPSNTNSPNVIAVAATDNRDALWTSSNYGSNKVHLGAPGVGIRSTWPGDTYVYADGTSMAAPHVAGAGALIRSACAFNTGPLKQTILNNVDAIPSLSGKTVTGGRLNLDTSIDSCTTGTSGSTTYARVEYRVCPPFPSWPDTGFVTLRVDGVDHTVTFNQNDTPRTIANRLATAVNYHYDSTTTATVSDVSSSCSGRYNARLTLTARAKGPLTNYPYYLSLVDQGGPGCYACPYFRVVPTGTFYFSGGHN